MNQGQLWVLISVVSPIVLLIGIVVGLFYFKRLNKSCRVIVAYFTIAMIFDLVSRYLGFYSDLKYNLFMIPLFGFLELMVFSILYYKYIFRISSIPLLLFIVTMHLLILFEIIITPKLLQRESFHSLGKVIADVSIIFFCMLYYWKVFKAQIPIDSEYSLLNAAIFAYYSINLFIYLSVNFLVNEKLSIVIFFWVVNLISAISFYLILIYLIWQTGKTRKILQ